VSDSGDEAPREARARFPAWLRVCILGLMAVVALPPLLIGLAALIRPDDAVQAFSPSEEFVVSVSWGARERETLTIRRRPTAEEFVLRQRAGRELIPDLYNWVGGRRIVWDRSAVGFLYVWESYGESTWLGTRALAYELLDSPPYAREVALDEAAWARDAASACGASQG